MSPNSQGGNAIDKHFNRRFEQYRYLAKTYARKIHSYEDYGIEYGDIVQELEMKIFLSMQTYSNSWQEYIEKRKTKGRGWQKPMPLEYYLRTALNNKVKDIIKGFKDPEKYPPAPNSSIQDIKFDFGNNVEFGEDTEIDIRKGVMIVRGMDMFKGLDRNEKAAFLLYIQGHQLGKIRAKFQKAYGSDITRAIKAHIERLRDRIEGGDRYSAVLEFGTEDMKYNFSFED